MAKPISETPILYGDDARRFLKKMKEPPTEKDKEFKRRFDKQRKVLF